MKYSFVLFCVLCAVATQIHGAADTVARWHDPGFEQLSPGTIAGTGRVESGWEIQKKGREAIRPRLSVEVIGEAARAKSGMRCLALSIPQDTVGFEFVTVGQRVQLAAGREYEAGVWARWPEGPDAATEIANATSGHRSAIVSFWARHRDGTGHFAGRDEWLFDNRWHKLTFRFRATAPEQPTLVYVSLLPNQKPAATTVLLDDFKLRELPDEPMETETRTGSLAIDANFSAQKIGGLSPPWYFANIGGQGARGEIATEDSGNYFRLAMNRDTSNFESAQLWQHVALRQGAHYEVRCRIRWDNFTPDTPAPIVNYGIFHEPTRTWYGPVDQVLETNGDWHEYRFIHIPPFPGSWKLYVQLNGWGNFGHGVTVSVDDFQCVPSGEVTRGQETKPAIPLDHP